MGISKRDEMEEKNSWTSPAEVVGPAEDSGIPSHDEIALLAYELYVSRGLTEGGELDDWLQAERELLARAKAPALKSKGTTA